MIHLRRWQIFKGCFIAPKRGVIQGEKCSFMLDYVIKRGLMMVLTLFLIISLTFVLMHAIPGGPFTSEKMLAPEIEAALNAKYHLDDPLWLQYLNYLKGVVMLDLGPSFKYPGVRVNDLILDGLPVTAKTGFLALICVVALGYRWAWWRRSIATNGRTPRSWS